MVLARTYWTILADSNRYQSFTILDHNLLMLPLKILGQGQNLYQTWKPLYPEFYRDEEGEEEKKPIGDFVQLSGPSINLKAKEILEPYIGNTVEFLPLKTDLGTYFTMNVSLVDCLDMSLSEVKRFHDGGIMHVERYAFYENRLKDIHLFHIPELKGSRWFVSDKFKRVVEANSLQGLLFYPIAEEISSFQ